MSVVVSIARGHDASYPSKTTGVAVGPIITGPCGADYYLSAVEKCGEVAETQWFRFGWGRVIAGFPEKSIAQISSRRAQTIETTFALADRHEKGRGHAPGQLVLASMGRFANAMKRRAKGPPLDFTARLRIWERPHVWPSATSREPSGAQHHTQAPPGARGDTDAELARKAGWLASRGELTHAQERAVMAAGLAARAPSEGVPILYGEQTAALICVDLGQPLTQLHAGAAGG